MLKVGHRGARGYEPENTLRSFKKAIALGADMIELDVHTCKSGEIVVIHDDKVDRTTSGKGRVAGKTLTDLKKLDAGKGEKIPTLEQVLDLFEGKIKVDIELKGKNCATGVAAILGRHIRTKGLKRTEFLVTSFKHDTLLTQFHEASPGIPIGFLYRRVPDDFAARAAAMGAECVVLYHRNTTREVVHKAHNSGLKVIVWTVNEPQEIERAKELGVDGIASDFPDRLKKSK
jgi:glycerophosphoryl diester phosphodiesterase